MFLLLPRPHRRDIAAPRTSPSAQCSTHSPSRLYSINPPDFCHSNKWRCDSGSNATISHVFHCKSTNKSTHNPIRRFPREYEQQLHTNPAASLCRSIFAAKPTVLVTAEYGFPQNKQTAGVSEVSLRSFFRSEFQKSGLLRSPNPPTRDLPRGSLGFWRESIRRRRESRFSAHSGWQNSRQFYVLSQNRVEFWNLGFEEFHPLVFGIEFSRPSALQHVIRAAHFYDRRFPRDSPKNCDKKIHIAWARNNRRRFPGFSGFSDSPVSPVSPVSSGSAGKSCRKRGSCWIPAVRGVRKSRSSRRIRGSRIRETWNPDRWRRVWRRNARWRGNCGRRRFAAPKFPRISPARGPGREIPPRGTPRCVGRERE